MFMNGAVFWFLMGILFVVVVVGMKAFADDRGWRITWWKAGLAGIWYGILSLSLYAWGTLIGEREAGAGFRLFLLGLFASIVFGVGLFRLLSHRPESPPEG